MAEKQFLDFLDRIDGGGMGQSGATFEGGGLLSTLGNLVASPYGSEDPERRAARQAFYGSDQIGGEPINSAPVRPASALTTASPTPYGPQAGSSLPPELEASYTGMPAPAPAGPSINPANAYGPAAMTFQDFVAGLGPIAQTASPEDLMTAYRQHMMGY